MELHCSTWRDVVADAHAPPRTGLLYLTHVLGTCEKRPAVVFTRKDVADGGLAVARRAGAQPPGAPNDGERSFQRGLAAFASKEAGWYDIVEKNGIKLIYRAVEFSEFEAKIGDLDRSESRPGAPPLHAAAACPGCYYAAHPHCQHCQPGCQPGCLSRAAPG